MPKERAVSARSWLHTPARCNTHSSWDALQQEERTNNFHSPHERPKKIKKVCHA